MTTTCEVKNCSRLVEGGKTFGYECGPAGRELCPIHQRLGGLTFKQP